MVLEKQPATFRTHGRHSLTRSLTHLLTHSIVTIHSLSPPILRIMSSAQSDQEEVLPGTEDINEEEVYGGDEEEGGDNSLSHSLTANTTSGGDGDNDDGAEIEEMKKRVQEMEEEHEKLTMMQHQVEKQINATSDGIDENSM